MDAVTINATMLMQFASLNDAKPSASSTNTEGKSISAPFIGRTDTISARHRITEKTIRPAKQNAMKAPAGPAVAMFSPELTKRPIPTAPENPIPFAPKHINRSRLTMRGRKDITGDMVPLKPSVKAVLAKYLMLEPAQNSVAALSFRLFSLRRTRH
ncbi:hypothetical protein MMC12_003141 [Toensbergia leucococca]|nr:hypothetical protein [Toensbergia leucococca]